MEEENLPRHRLKLTDVSEADFTTFTGTDLIVKTGSLDYRAVNIMLDSGTTCNVVNPGLLQHVLSEVTRYDAPNEGEKGVANVSFEGYQFFDVPVIEWPINSSHDLVLGKP